METYNLVKRARELAKLAEKATPGPWSHIGNGRIAQIDRAVAMVHNYNLHPQHGVADAELIAAAPEMADLLAKLADELDWIIRWALERCYAECGRGFLERGMHGPDCLIDELALWDLVQHEEYQKKRRL